MTTTAKQDGRTMAYTAPTGGVTNGALVEVVDMVGVAYDAITAGEVGTLLTQGVFTITNTAHAAGGFSQGDSVYLSSTGLVTNSSTSNQFVGIAWAASATSATTVDVNINWGTGA